MRRNDMVFLLLKQLFEQFKPILVDNQTTSINSVTIALENEKVRVSISSRWFLDKVILLNDNLTTKLNSWQRLPSKRTQKTYRRFVPF